MTVSELIAILRDYPQNLEVTYACCSEQCLIEASDMYVYEACYARPDGWVQNKRPDMPFKQYLHLPGN